VLTGSPGRTATLPRHGGETFDWFRAIPVPELAMKEVKELMLLVQ